MTVWSRIEVRIFCVNEIKYIYTFTCMYISYRNNNGTDKYSVHQWKQVRR